ncbi:MAG TPA: GNAT family N-acetyltransferase [Candidatus Limnocylindrales bacterium]
MEHETIHLRQATPDDQAVILGHRRGMFRDMWAGTSEQLDRMIEATAPWLAGALADGSYRGWLAVTADGQVVAGGGVIVTPWLARPREGDPRRAVIVNVYTEPGWRGRGLARRIMEAILAWLREQGLQSVDLHASDAGRHLYETLGFEPTNEMRLRLT